MSLAVCKTCPVCEETYKAESFDTIQSFVESIVCSKPSCKAVSRKTKQSLREREAARKITFRELIEPEMDYYGITRQEMAEKCKLTIEDFENLLDGLYPMSKELAHRMSSAGVAYKPEVLIKIYNERAGVRALL